jgi:glycosyltransferase involved in cell wall biosynthesis
VKTLKVTVVAEYYPRRDDPVLGVWAHRQALAAADAGAQVRVLVLHRLVPPRSAFGHGALTAARAFGQLARQPLHEVRDGIPVTYVPYVSPPRPTFYPYWGAWAAPALGVALRTLRASFPFELVHAHNAVPAGDALRRLRLTVPLAISVHGSDVLYTARGSIAGARAVSRTFGAARVVLANSRGTAELARGYGAHEVHVVHLGSDVPGRARAAQPQAAATAAVGSGVAHPLERLAEELPHRYALRDASGPPTLVTVAHLIPRKRHADVVRALAALSTRRPSLRYLVIGEGPERAALEALARSLGVGDRVEITGQLTPEEAIHRARLCTLLVMPSTEEAFGVAYIEAMAAGVPAIGCRGEPGPEEIAAEGPGIELVAAGDVAGLAHAIDELLADPQRLRALGERARETVATHFTWERCGEATLDAYRLALQ